MKITCPSCETSYALPDGAIKDPGRDVRCSRCGNTWFVGPEDSQPQDATIAEDMSDLTDDAVADAWGAAMAEEAADVDPEPLEQRADLQTAVDTDAEQPADGIDAAESDQNVIQDIETVARPRRNRLRRNRARSRRILLRIAADLLHLRRYAGVFLLVLSIGVVTVFLAKRTEIVRAVPDLGSLYEAVGLQVNLRGLEFRDVATYRDFEEGAPILVVEGRILNVAKNQAKVPSVRLGLRGLEGEEIYAWATAPEEPVLESGGYTTFKTRLTAPPERAKRVQVRFTDRQTGRTALR